MLQSLNNSTILLPDANIVLANPSNENSNLVEQFNVLFTFFESHFGKSSSVRDDSESLNNYSQFISAIINRRCDRVEKWLNANIQPYQPDHQEVVQTKQEL